MEVESHVLHWTCFSHSLLQRPSPMPGPHQQGDWGKCSQALVQMACISCVAYMLPPWGLSNWEGVWRRMQGTVSIKIFSGTLGKTLWESGYHYRQVPIACRLKIRRSMAPLFGHMSYEFHWVLYPALASGKLQFNFAKFKTASRILYAFSSSQVEKRLPCNTR